MVYMSYIRGGGSRISGKEVQMCKGREFALLIYLLFLKYPLKMKQFGLSETKLFHFHGIFK